MALQSRRLTGINPVQGQKLWLEVREIFSGRQEVGLRDVGASRNPHIILTHGNPLGLAEGIYRRIRLEDIGCVNRNAPEISQHKIHLVEFLRPPLPLNRQGAQFSFCHIGNHRARISQIQGVLLQQIFARQVATDQMNQDIGVEK